MSIRNIKKKLVTVAAACALAVTVPGAASAVIFNDSIGGGYQYRLQTYGNGASVNGALRSSNGSKVYYQGRVHSFSTIWCSGTKWSRYTTDTTSKTNVARGGAITALAWTCSGPVIQSRTARNVALMPELRGRVA